MWQFGPYQVQGLIARGGMGEILRAYDTRHDRVVALKVLAEHLAADREFRERFKTEAHAAARLNDPHVIPIHSYGEIDGRLYLDMRLVEGNDVGSLLAASGPMSPHSAVAIIEQIAQALDAAHAQGVVHRDVKPSNIMVATGGFAYLVDFGIAHSARTNTSLTSTGFTVGTLAYMAPERFNDAPADARSDVYSLACVLYQCVTGTKPFDGDTAASLIHAQLNLMPPAPSHVGPAVPRGLDEVIGRGMSKDPAQRFTAAGEFARAARDALTRQLPAGVPTADSGRRSGMGAGAKWGLAGGIAAAVLLAAAGSYALLQPLGGTDDVGQPRPVPADPPASQPQTSPPQTETSAADPGEPAPPESEIERTADLPPEEPAPEITQWCKSISFAGEERGTGCYDATQQALTAHDTNKDGMWIRTDSWTDYRQDDECRDYNSEGDAEVCPIDVEPDSRVRFQVELWDAKTRISETSWTVYLPARP
ncbi:protein kinase [Saccharopolyspora sp. HNM0983]|uniref:non-specific serine/threonine protein kinase n=1 Tax=Saccharopolyspora montiporae TaxID=2781240 RepID=A0A929FZW4_9PSEU|nr:serine/threonine-protein kinase [Saccharopolyspora sp. HNM0983]MBE9372983.1 protein kinase [Saccharopolyspora sp. HNM0983]